MAAAVAYYLGLSFFPLLLVLIAGVGLFFRYSQLGQSAEDQVLAALGEHLAPSLRDQVRQALAQVKDRSALNGPVALAGLVIAAMAVFTQFDRAFDRIWSHQEPEQHGILASIQNVLVVRGVAFLMLLGIGLIVVVIFLGGLALSTVQKLTDDLLPAPNAVWTLAQIGMTLSLNALVFMLLYRWLPQRDVRWGDALRGAVVAAIGWEIGRHVLAFFIVGKYATAYGVVGSFIAIQLWCYYALIVVFLGAEYIQELIHEREGKTMP
jgi:membrane protein